MNDTVGAMYAEEIVSAFDVYKPEILPEVFNRYGDQGAEFFNMLRTLGFDKPTAQDEFSHFENNRLHHNFTNKTLVADQGAGNSVNVTLVAADLDAGNRFYPRKYDSVIFPNETVGQITSINTATPSAPILTIMINDVLDTAGAIPANQELVIYSNAWAEGSAHTSGVVTGKFKYTNCTQIIKEAFEVTGSELVRQTWIRVNGKANAPLVNEAVINMDYRLALKFDGALMFSKKTTNTALVDDVNGRKIKTTEGLIPAMRKRAQKTPYTVGAFDIDTFDAMDRTLDAQWANNYILSLLAIDLHQEVENELVTYLANTNIDYTRKVMNSRLFNKNEAKAAAVNFTLFTKSERTFCMKRLSSFSNANTVGASGYDQRHMGIFLPINSQKDPVNNDMVRSLGMRYRAFGPYNRMSEVYSVNGAGPGLKVSEIDANKTLTRVHIGAQQMGMNQAVLVHKA
jgi:hypothetical protein